MSKFDRLQKALVRAHYSPSQKVRDNAWRTISKLRAELGVKSRVQGI